MWATKQAAGWSGGFFRNRVRPGCPPLVACVVPKTGFEDFSSFSWPRSSPRRLASPVPPRFHRPSLAGWRFRVGAAQPRALAGASSTFAGAARACDVGEPQRTIARARVENDGGAGAAPRSTSPSRPRANRAINAAQGDGIDYRGGCAAESRIRWSRSVPRVPAAGASRRREHERRRGAACRRAIMRSKRWWLGYCAGRTAIPIRPTRASARSAD